MMAFQVPLAQGPLGYSYLDPPQCGSSSGNSTSWASTSSQSTSSALSSSSASARSSKATFAPMLRDYSSSTSNESGNAVNSGRILPLPPLLPPLAALSPNEGETANILLPQNARESDQGKGGPLGTGRLSRATKDVLFGSLAGMVAKVFEHPFDLIKVRLQTQPFSSTTLPDGSTSAPRGTLYAGPFDAFSSTIRKEGIVGLYRGLSMPIIGATVENATLFFTYNFVQGQIRKWNAGSGPSLPSEMSTSSLDLDSSHPLSLPQLSIAAAAAGAVTSFGLTPIELIKCQMQVQMISVEAAILAREAAQTSTSTAVGGASLPSLAPKTAAATTASSATASSLSAQLSAARKTLPGPFALTMSTIRDSGIKGLWLGQTGTLLRETGGGIAWFLAFESVSRFFISQKAAAAASTTRVTKDDLETWKLILSGAAAGVSYNVVLFPADVVKSTIQTEAQLNSNSNSSSSSSSSSSSATSSGIKPPPKQPPTRPNGFLSTFSRIYAERGLKGLYAGCGITCLRSGPSSALIFLLYSRLEGWADRRGW